MNIWIPFVTLSIALTGCHDEQKRPSAAVVPVPPAAADMLDAMDTRVPVPLLPMMANHQKQNMRDHLHAVQEIIAAVGARDFGGVARAAATIGYSEPMGQMCNHMGAGAPGFTEQALRFHHTADTISAAARSRDMAGVLTALNETLATCTGCHSAFKQRVVDETTWAAIAGEASPRRQ
jgi:hypothetical protein